MKRMELKRKRSFYEKYIKRLLDIVCSLFTLIVFWWLYIIVAILVKINLGSPVVFRQARPGIIDPKTGKEKIFYMYKFRTMSDKRDEKGNFLPDEVRLGRFGKMLRNTSLDELMEVFNILKGDMSIIGPRPQLVRDMVFMSEEQRMRHTAKPGLSGLAQVKGRNAISWENKLNLDLQYIRNISFLNDCKLVLETFQKAIMRQDGITDGEHATSLDYGDELLNSGKIDRAKYEALQAYAKNILANMETKKTVSFRPER
ncbi:bacterial sugar transferase [Oribacterium parvum ACB8]|jgi:capsular polysaccharide biosynthesis protein cps4E|uniref:sugar transferase n=1 Tax=Oribacterium parvum TaxID=1501329 RepID=UPI00026F08AD|nr:sugar transferase [Oribacterium parvum]EJF12220.1 bacterial sugar transferase [Oribacterium parvum ACB8]